MITNEQIESRFSSIISQCRDVFAAKLQDYGPTWAIFREISLIDQMWIKIKRIRNIDEKKDARISDKIDVEFIAIINYAIIWLMRLRYPGVAPHSELIVRDVSLIRKIDTAKLIETFDGVMADVVQLFRAKNHDYDNAWQDMSIQSIIDMTMIKILRIKNIYLNSKVTVSEDIDAQLDDIIIYSMFALIKMDT